MNIQDIQRVRSTNKIKIPFYDRITSYYYYCLIILLDTVLLLYLLNYNTVVKTNPKLTIILSILFIILTMVIFYSTTLIPNKYKLVSISSDTSNINLDKAIKKTAKKLEWGYKKVNNNQYHLERYINFISWGEEIIIITFDNKLLANSFSEYHPLIYNFDKRNINSFKKTFYEIIENDSEVILNEQV